MKKSMNKETKMTNTLMDLIAELDEIYAMHTEAVAIEKEIQSLITQEKSKPQSYYNFAALC